MKTAIASLLSLLLTYVIAHATGTQIKSDGYVTFVSLTDASSLTSLTPVQHAWSYRADSIGMVYAHHRFYTNDGSEFSIDRLLSAVDSDGDGEYDAFQDVAGLQTPGTSPAYILRKDGVTLPKVFMRNQFCDEVIILNQVLGGRSASRGAKWVLDTGYPDALSWTTHAPIDPFRNNISIQNYIGELHVIANGNTDDIVEYSYDLATWADYFTLPHSGVIVVHPPAVEVGKPKKFFRMKP